MALEDIPLFAGLRAKLGYDSERQTVIAQNVANADTPGYSPGDLKAFSFDEAMRSQNLALTPVTTNAAHLPGNTSAATRVWRTEDVPDSESRLDGNRVVLEEQMMKMSEARADYDTAITLYQKSLTLLRLAIRKPGG